MPPKPTPVFYIAVTPIPLPARDRIAPRMGAFRLEEIWQLRSASRMFGGYSALLSENGKDLLAFSDSGLLLRFTPPGRNGPPPEASRLDLGTPRPLNNSDLESATRDPRSGQFWFGIESRNQIVRMTRNFRRTGIATPRAMAHWGDNTGPESLVRLHDGRFLTVREVPDAAFGATGNQGLLFDGDPVERDTPLHFTFDGPHNFSVTDMAQMPDGRVLILMRRVVWPLPIRLAGRIAIGDPREIREGGVWYVREIARLSTDLPVDNFEGLTIEPQGDGKLVVWIISDDNHAVLERTLLWKMRVDPADLPWPVSVGEERSSGEPKI